MTTVSTQNVEPRTQTVFVDSKAGNKTGKQRITPLMSLCAGSIAGGVEASITYPFEFAKTRAQLQGSTFRNPLAVLGQETRKNGIKSIYTGCSTLILGTTFKAGVRFLSFDYIKAMLVDDEGKLTPMNGVFAGMIAGAVESIVAVTPTERLKTALIDDAKGQNRRFRNGPHALSTIVREGGINELYRGLASTTLKQSSTSAVRMGSYNTLKELGNDYNIPQNAWSTFCNGAVAGVITVYATQPFDTTKTRAQGAKGATTREAFYETLRGGVRSFWSGSTMRLGRLVLSGGIVFSVYEQIASILVRA